MKIQRRTDWVDHLLGILCVFLIWFCVLVVKEASAHEPRQVQQPAVWTGPTIQKCDKELWLRIKDGCNEI